jgi:hypothetical protein
VTASVATGDSRARVRPGLVVGIVAGVLALLVVVGLAAPARRQEGPPLDPRSTTSTGTRAAVELAGVLGADVRVTSELPGDDVDVAIMFEDLVADDVVGDLTAWVSEGHTLVIADPGSQLTPPAELHDGPPFEDTTTVQRGRCDATEPAGLDRLGALEVAGGYARFEVPDGASSCFADAEGALVVVEPVGSGRLVSVGTPWVFTNSVLDQRDDAGLFAALAVPVEGTRLAVLVAGEHGTGIQPPDEGGDLSLPAGVGLALVQLLVAFVVYALARARRLGRPVPEDPPVAIAGSELVRAVGGLLEHANARDRAAASLRRSARRRLAAAFGLATGADAPTVVATVAARSRLDRDRLARALQDEPVADDAALAALGRELDVLVDTALGRPPSPPPPGGAP